MRKKLVFLLPLTLLLLFVQFNQAFVAQSALFRTGKSWVSAILTNYLPANGAANRSLSASNLNKGNGVLLNPAENQGYSYDQFFWSLPFMDGAVANIIVPFRLKSDVDNNQPALADKGQKSLHIPLIEQEITDPKVLASKFEYYEGAITVVKNKSMLIPFRELDTLSFASLAIGQAKGGYFQEYLAKYAPFQHYSVNDPYAANYEALIEKLEGFNTVIISLHNLNASSLQSYGIPLATRTFIERLRTKTNVAVVVFGTPQGLKYFDRMDYLMCAYDNNSITQKLVPQILFGAIPASGKLPVTVNADLKAGMGIATTSLKRLGYSTPERVGLQTASLQRIDRIVEACIKDTVMPGAQVLIAKNGKVIYEKAYGYFTYDKQTPVTKRTLFDLASVTKVAATLQAVMALQANGTLNLHRKVSDYLPELKGTNKENIIIQDVLLHQAGLIAFQEHWMRTKTAQRLDSTFYSTVLDEQHPLEVAPGIYGVASLKDSLWKWTIQSRLLKKQHAQKHYPYKYSDVGFDILQQVVERLVKQPLDAYLSQTFYQPLGLDELTFNPLRKFEESQIAPTELDNRFRGVLVRGTVHDQQAALMGGVAGHAGLFGTAHDLAVLMQMNLQRGFYGGKQFLNENTIPTFTKTHQANNPRGLGWDRPNPEAGLSVAELASRNSFGHTGFTGTCVWVDPDEEIVYIFLSNRVYPSADNTKLARYKVRQLIQNVIYQSKSTSADFMAQAGK